MAFTGPLVKLLGEVNYVTASHLSTLASYLLWAHAPRNQPRFLFLTTPAMLATAAFASLHPSTAESQHWNTSVASSSGPSCGSPGCPATITDTSS